MDRRRAARRACRSSFTASGSAQGRKDFALGNADFAVSDIGYQGTDPVTGETDTSHGRAVRLPADRRRRHVVPVPDPGRPASWSRNLRLSGQTLAKIFTNQITNWNDPAITADNNGRALPSLPIIPVVHSEGSGSTAQFTAYLANAVPVDLGGRSTGTAGLTEYFPRKGDQMVAQNGSDGVMNFITSAPANGAIGYDEYSYALRARTTRSRRSRTRPATSRCRRSTTSRVADPGAVINNDPTSPNYLLQNLDNVYTYTDPRTYPLSSYSYMIIPTGAERPDA